MIYVDSSVALAHIFREPRRTPDSIWMQPLVSSCLLQHEIWTRLHGRQLAQSHSDAARALIDHVELIDLSPVVLARALEPFPISVRTLDALHLASIEFVRARGQQVELASFDRRLLAAARAWRCDL